MVERRAKALSRVKPGMRGPSPTALWITTNLNYSESIDESNLGVSFYCAESQLVWSHFSYYLIPYKIAYATVSLSTNDTVILCEIKKVILLL